MDLIFHCEVKHCYYHVLCRTQERYDSVAANHGCPNNCGTTTYGPEYMMSLLEEIWKQLDESVTYIIENPNGPQAEWHKAYAQGLAYTLAKFMNPHFTTPQEISREAKKRYDERKAGHYYDTPGIASKKLVLPATARSFTESAVTRATQAVRQLNEKETQGIINGKGFFSAIEVARMYQTTPAHVELLWSS